MGKCSEKDEKSANKTEGRIAAEGETPDRVQSHDKFASSRPNRLCRMGCKGTPVRGSLLYWVRKMRF